MAHQNLPITQLVTPAAKAARADLLSALGTENNPSQWMDFMAQVRRHLPDILSKGRPSHDAIARSLIGQHGFTSWKQMVEAPTDQQGLGWSWSAWRQWSRAWRVVEDHPVLRGQPITAAQVNRLADEIRNAGAEWPDNTEQLAQFRKSIEEGKAGKREQSQAAMAARIEALEAQVQSLEAKRRETIQTAKKKISRLEGERDEARRALASARKDAPRPTAPKMSRWQHLMAALGLR
jgi:polyhydroxyalkanoate synthesis regulator phasin